LESLDVEILYGHDDKPGWNTNQASKVKMYNTYAGALREAYRAGLVLLGDAHVHSQLASIDRKTLSHPEKKTRKCVDDEATAEVIAETARSCEGPGLFGGWAGGG